jgi:hypothetical protein
MANPLEVTRYIRFQLSELGARNAHHEFEHLTRYLARVRVCSNIMPATGPVSAGGDGGRDFETFKTYNEIPLTPDNSFHRLTSGERDIAFACSIQKDIIPKIRKELKRAKNAGQYKDLVFFCEENVPVAKRQKLQSEAKKLEMGLDIFDGAAIAEMLSDRDTFWIAQTYLQIPSNLMPEPDDSRGWYKELVAKWVEKTPLPFSYSDFSELKIGAKRSVRNESARSDLKMWIEKLQTFRKPPSSRELQRWANYEIVLATLNGMASFEGLEPIVNDYFSDFEAHLGIGDLVDAVNLRNYLAGAKWKKLYPSTAPDLSEIEKRLVSILEFGLDDAPGPGRRAELLQLLGTIHLSIFKDGKPSLATVASYWTRMLDEAEQAKFFLFQEFNEFYTQVLGVFGNPVELADLAPRLDDLIAARSGSKEVGGNAEERGDNYRDQDDLVGALKEYQRARKRLFDGGDEVALIYVVLKMAHCFRSLGLLYAAKYYALSAAWMSANPSRPMLRKFLPDGLLAVSEMEYSSGNFVSFSHYAYLSRIAELAHGSMEQASPIAENVGHIYGLLGLLKRKSPVLYENLKPGYASWPSDIFGDLFEVSSAPGFWDEGSIEEATSNVSALLVDRPWGDLTEHRDVRWKALGISWSCCFKNDYATVVVAEKFIAQLQLALAAIAIEKADLLLIPTTLNLSLSTSDTVVSTEISDAEFESEAWNLTVVTPTTCDKSEPDLTQIATFLSHIIGRFSLFNTQEFLLRSKTWIKTAMEIGFSFRSYEDVLSEFTPNGTFVDNIFLCSDAPFEFTGIGNEFESIPAFSGLSPNYNRDDLLKRISDRYAAAIPNLQFTARNALKDPTNAIFFRALHSDGMKDWYLLCILSGMALQAKLDKESITEITSEVASRMQAMSRQVETPESALFLQDYTPEHLRAFEIAFAPLLMSSLGLNPDFELLHDPVTLEVIKDRFSLRIADVEHSEVFVWE